MISAITNQGLCVDSFFEGAIDTERFTVFLKDLIQDAQRKGVPDRRQPARASCQPRA